MSLTLYYPHRYSLLFIQASPENCLHSLHSFSYFPLPLESIISRLLLSWPHSPSFLWVKVKGFSNFLFVKPNGICVPTWLSLPWQLLIITISFFFSLRYNWHIPLHYFLTAKFLDGTICEFQILLRYSQNALPKVCTNLHCHYQY